MYQLIMGAKVETYPKDSVIVQVKFMHGDADHYTSYNYIFGVLKEDWVLTGVVGFVDTNYMKTRELNTITLNAFLGAIDRYKETNWNDRRDYISVDPVLSVLWNDAYEDSYWPEDITISEWDYAPALYDSHKLFYNDFDGILFHLTTEKIEND